MVTILELIKKLRKKTGAGVIDCKNALKATNNNVDDAVEFLNKKGFLISFKKKNNIVCNGVVSVCFDDYSIVIFEVNCETDFVAKNKQFCDLIEKIKIVLLKNRHLENIDDILKSKMDDGKILIECIYDVTLAVNEKIFLRRFTRIFKFTNQKVGYYIHSNSRIGALVLFDRLIDDDSAKKVAMHVVAMNPKFLSRDNILESDLMLEKKKIMFEIKNNQNYVHKQNNVIEKIVEGRLNKIFSNICLYEQSFIFDLSINVRQFINNIESNIIKYVRYEVGEKI